MRNYLNIKDRAVKRYGNSGSTGLAKALGMPTATVYTHLQGTSEPNFETLCVYAEHFGVDVRDLFVGTMSDCFVVHISNPPHESLIK